ncbi:unnamed protein product [Diamesa tonsa]
MNKWTIVLLIVAVTMVVVEGATIKTEKDKESKAMESNVFEEYFGDEEQPQPQSMENEETQQKEVNKYPQLDDVEEINEEF